MRVSNVPGSFRLVHSWKRNSLGERGREREEMENPYDIRRSWFVICMHRSVKNYQACMSVRTSFSVNTSMIIDNYATTKCYSLSTNFWNNEVSDWWLFHSKLLMVYYGPWWHIFAIEMSRCWHNLSQHVDLMITTCQHNVKLCWHVEINFDKSW